MKSPDGQHCTHDVHDGPDSKLQLLPRLIERLLGSLLGRFAVAECTVGISGVALAFAAVATVAFADFVGSVVVGFAAGAVDFDSFDVGSVRFAVANYVDVVVERLRPPFSGTV